MKVEQRKITELVESKNNVRKHGETQIKEFVRSIEQFGVIRPIVIDENNVILAGHGLYKALLSMGKEDVDVIVEGGLTENQKKKLLLADNKIYDLGIHDFDAIENIFAELKGDFDIPGYDEDTLNELYGIGSIEAEADKELLESKEIPESQTGVEYVTPSPQNSFAKDTNIKSTPDAKPSSAVEEARHEYEEEEKHVRFVICPNCGQRIDL